VPDSPIAIITGAGSGIGRAAAMQLASDGWRCALVGRRTDRLDETAAQIHARSSSAPALIVAADLGEPATADRIVTAVAQKWGGRIDALINNAAVLHIGPIREASEEAIRDSFEINTIAPTRLVQRVWPIMARQRRGRIINVSSIASIDPFPGLGVYGMSKCALEGLTHAINTEGRADGILAFSLVLGAVETEMLRRVVSEKDLPRDQVQSPQKVARVIAECARGERDAEAGKANILT